MEAIMKKYVVEYELPYTHIVRVGIEAKSAAGAIKKAQRLFDKAQLWDDTQEVPVLMDQFEENGDAGVPVEFTATEVDTYHEVDASVKALRSERACKAFVRAFLTWCETASSNRGLGRLHNMADEAIAGGE
ncbi:hypothetical protein B1B_12035 [mine drainage metagenome]|uniref:Uncharacterized protein n=1 Tax=mine drainage metagenome TaxID=410659 RepID=T1B271_9ZZZZ